jgi:hypothetical protein
MLCLIVGFAYEYKVDVFVRLKLVLDTNRSMKVASTILNMLRLRSTPRRLWSIHDVIHIVAESDLAPTSFELSRARSCRSLNPLPSSSFLENDPDQSFGDTLITA